MHKLRFTYFWLVIGFLLTALVMFASLMRNPPQIASFNHSDKAYHIAAYFGLTFWFSQIYLRNRVRWAIGFIFAMLGVGLEYLQGATGYRSFEYADMAANTAGILVGLLLAQTPLVRVLLAVDRYMDRLVR